MSCHTLRSVELKIMHHLLCQAVSLSGHVPVEDTASNCLLLIAKSFCC